MAQVRAPMAGTVLELPVSQGDTVRLGAIEVRVLDTPGHTAGHIVYYIPSISTAFVGDTLFALGCGRLFEGTADQMWASLSKLRGLPDDTTIYCAHEYTAANAAFALSVDPDNAALIDYAEDVKQKRSRNVPTVPTTIAKEKAANPFLRADILPFQKAMGHAGDAVATFAEVRKRKDNF